MKKSDKEQFKTYYQRKAKRKYSLFGAAKEAFIFAVVMLMGVVLPVTLIFIYSDRLGPWWWIILLIYSSILSIIIYAIYRYRDILAIRGYYTDEEFETVFQNELWLVRIMDKLRKYLIN